MRFLIQSRNKTTLVLLFFVSVLACSAFAFPDEENVVNLVNKASAYCKTHGKEKAMKAFNDSNGEFIQGELYIFAYDFTGTNLAHGLRPQASGKNYIDLQDDDGNYVIMDMITLSKLQGNGWVQYRTINPRTKQVEQRSSYIIKIDDYFVGCGIFISNPEDKKHDDKDKRTVLMR